MQRPSPIRATCLASLTLAVSATLPSAANVTVASSSDCPWPGPPQFLAHRPSPPDSTIVSLGGARVKVCYSRPSARGRTVFGGIVRYGAVWRTGANEPTMLFLPVAAEVAGATLDAGRYLLLTVPGPDEWTLLFNASDARTPAEMFRDMAEVGRGAAIVEALEEHVETFTIRGVDGDEEAALYLEWERVRVRVPIRLRG